MVHAFRIDASPDAVELLRQKVEVELNRTGRVLIGQDVAIALTPDGLSAEGVYRTSASKTPEQILDGLQRRGLDTVAWYAIQYHECSHDGTVGGCGAWQTLAFAGPVPESLMDMLPPVRVP